MKRIFAFSLGLLLMLNTAFAADMLRNEEYEQFLSSQMGMTVEEILAADEEQLITGAKSIAYVRDVLDYLFQIIVTQVNKNNPDAAKELVPNYSRVTNIKAIDLQELDTNELAKLRDSINIALWQSNDWQEVLVPEGLWKIGEDIPVGHWTIRPASTTGYITVEYGNKLQNDKKSLSFTGDYWTETIIGKESFMYELGKAVECDIKVLRNYYIEISGGGVIFTPYAGKPDLGFK